MRRGNTLEYQKRTTDIREMALRLDSLINESDVDVCMRDLILIPVEGKVVRDDY